MLENSTELNNQTVITNSGARLIVELEDNGEQFTLRNYYTLSADGTQTAEMKESARGSEAPTYGATSSAPPNLAAQPSATETGEAESVLAATLRQNLPFFARWLDIGRIHSIERQTLPEFFREKPSKSPGVYLQMRNFMIGLYWHNPKAYLTASACRRALRGDICGVLRAHAFLEHWGIINFCYKPASLGWNDLAAKKPWYPALLRKDDAGAERKAAQAPSAEDAAECTLEELLALKDYLLSQEEPREDALDCLALKRFGGADCQSLLVDSLFELAGLRRPPCERCQIPVRASWRAKSLEFGAEERDAKKRFIIICENCFFDENFPIFYSKNMFFRISVLDLTLPGKKDSVDANAKWSIAEKNVILRRLEKEADLETAVRSLRADLAHRSLMEILAEILRTAIILDSVSQKSGGEIRENQFTCGESLELKFEAKLSDISQLLDTAHTDEQQLRADSCAHLPQLEAVRERADAVSAFASRIELKLQFFEEFENIIQRQKQNLKILL